MRTVVSLALVPVPSRETCISLVLYQVRNSTRPSDINAAALLPIVPGNVKVRPYYQCDENNIHLASNQGEYCKYICKQGHILYCVKFCMSGLNPHPPYDPESRNMVTLQKVYCSKPPVKYNHDDPFLADYKLTIVIAGLIRPTVNVTTNTHLA